MSNTIGLPLKYNNMCFNTVYNFCSSECVYNYLDESNINEYYEIYSLFKLYNSMIENNEYPLVKEISYNRQIKNDKNINIKDYKLHRRNKCKTGFFNIDQ
jgi:hypothetical protein